MVAQAPPLLFIYIIFNQSVIVIPPPSFPSLRLVPLPLKHIIAISITISTITPPPPPTAPSPPPRTPHLHAAGSGPGSGPSFFHPHHHHQVFLSSSSSLIPASPFRAANGTCRCAGDRASRRSHLGCDGSNCMLVVMVSAVCLLTADCPFLKRDVNSNHGSGPYLRTGTGYGYSYLPMIYLIGWDLTRAERKCGVPASRRGGGANS